MATSKQIKMYMSANNATREQAGDYFRTQSKGSKAIIDLGTIKSLGITEEELISYAATLKTDEYWGWVSPISIPGYEDSPLHISGNAFHQYDKNQVNAYNKVMDSYKFDEEWLNELSVKAEEEEFELFNDQIMEMSREEKLELLYDGGDELSDEELTSACLDEYSNEGRNHIQWIKEYIIAAIQEQSGIKILKSDEVISPDLPLIPSIAAKVDEFINSVVGQTNILGDVTFGYDTVRECYSEAACAQLGVSRDNLVKYINTREAQAKLA